MNSKTVAALLFALASAALIVNTGLAGAGPEHKKFLVILQAGTEGHEGLARALHAILYTKELKEAGHDVVLMFDGAGTTWAREFEKSDHKLHGQYMALKKLGVTQEICDYCSGAFQVRDSLTDEQKGFLDKSYGGHPSIARWVSQDYQIIVL